MPEQACPLGHYSLEGASNCTECPAGFQCSSRSSTPVACRPGTFSVTAATNCTSCAPGYYCPFTDSVDFYECPEGTYATGDASSCEACSPGFYCPEKTVDMEIGCPDGYFASGGAANCTACAAGFACSSDGTSIVACESGYYSQAGATECVGCPVGYYCPNTDSVRFEGFKYLSVAYVKERTTSHHPNRVWHSCSNSTVRSRYSCVSVKSLVGRKSKHSTRNHPQRHKQCTYR